MFAAAKTINSNRGELSRSKTVEQVTQEVIMNMGNLAKMDPSYDPKMVHYNPVLEEVIKYAETQTLTEEFRNEARERGMNLAKIGFGSRLKNLINK
jgi:hypothetical protein